MASLKIEKETLFLKEKGRDANEDALIYLRNGVYAGYGFVPKSVSVLTETDLEPFIELRENTFETTILVSAYLQKRSEIL